MLPCFLLRRYVYSKPVLTASILIRTHLTMLDIPEFSLSATHRNGMSAFHLALVWP